MLHRLSLFCFHVFDPYRGIGRGISPLISITPPCAFYCRLDVGKFPGAARMLYFHERQAASMSLPPITAL